MTMLEKDITSEGSDNRDRYLGIMGGDGSLATTIKMLRSKSVIEKALKQKLVSFVLLPFGTGCDTAQIFGWGNCPQDEDWLESIQTLTEEIVTAENDALSVWKVQIQTTRSERATERSKTDQTVFKPEQRIDVGIYDAFDEPVFTNEFLMCCYFNIGFEPRVGACK